MAPTQRFVSIFVNHFYYNFTIISQTTIKEEDSPKSDSNGSRFQVAKVTSNSGSNSGGNKEQDDSDDRDDDSEADNDSLRAHMYATAGYDTRNLKSFKHYTREALPRVDNYRNMASIHGHSERPTLDELHGVQTTVQFDNKVGEHFLYQKQAFQPLFTCTARKRLSFPVTQKRFG